MSLYIGNDMLDNLIIGNEQVDRLMLGETEIWSYGKYDLYAYYDSAENSLLDRYNTKTGIRTSRISAVTMPYDQLCFGVVGNMIGFIGGKTSANAGNYTVEAYKIDLNTGVKINSFQMPSTENQLTEMNFKGSKTTVYSSLSPTNYSPGIYGIDIDTFSVISQYQETGYSFSGAPEMGCTASKFSAQWTKNGETENFVYNLTPFAKEKTSPLSFTAGNEFEFLKTYGVFGDKKIDRYDQSTLTLISSANTDTSFDHREIGGTK